MRDWKKTYKSMDDRLKLLEDMQTSVYRGSESYRLIQKIKNDLRLEMLGFIKENTLERQLV